MTRILIRGLALALWFAGSSAYAAAAFKIVTADARGTYFAIGNDLAKFVAPSADIDLEVVATDGSAANIRLLREAPGVKFAIVQADVYQASWTEPGRKTAKRCALSRRCGSFFPCTTPRSITSHAPTRN
jgi:TRAP-type uncharacterized transport system substrate-binding protein